MRIVLTWIAIITRSNPLLLLILKAHAFTIVTSFSLKVSNLPCRNQCHNARRPRAPGARPGHTRDDGAQRVHYERSGRLRAAAVQLWADHHDPVLHRLV